MENTRNSFYLALRNALSVLNPSRVFVLRGVQRPGIMLEENESPIALALPDVFVLRWTELSVDDQHALPLAQQVCEVLYWTEGTSTNGGLDRGRLLSAMDEELTQLLSARNAAKQNYAVSPPAPSATRLFWSAASFGAIATSKNRLSRVAKVTVYSYEEAAEV
jgi:hypothetical protein